MTKTTFSTVLEHGQEAVNSFLSTLIGEGHEVSIETPQPLSVDELKANSGTYLSAVGELESGASYIVLLSPSMVPVVSESMMGEAMSADDSASIDLMQEVLAQAHGAVRSHLSAHDVRLPAATFNVVPNLNAFPTEALPGKLTKVGFHLTSNPELKGIVAFDHELAQSTKEASAAESEPTAKVAPAAFPDMGSEQSFQGDGGNLDMLADVELEITVELGRRKLPLAHVLSLSIGSIIELEKLVGEPLNIYANGRLIAEGEAVVIDEQFGVRVTRLASHKQRKQAFL